MAYMLEPGMARNMRRGHWRRALGLLLLLCLLSLFRGGCCFVLIIIVVAFATEVFGTFVFMWRAKLVDHRN